MKTVLIPTDFSDNAWDALLYAIRLYDTIATKFYILNTYQVTSSRTSNRIQSQRDTHFFRALKEESTNGLKKIKNHIDNHLLNDNHEYETISQTGDLLDTLKQIVTNKNIDIIIMGTTGATGAKEIFMGSNAVKVINYIDRCPVITVPKDHEFTELNKITFATDLKRRFGSIELFSLIELQSIHNCTINILNVKESKNLEEFQCENLEIITSFFYEGKTSFLEIKLQGKIAKSIIDFSEKNNTDLVCLVNSEKKFLKKLMQESVIKKISFHSTIPLLVIPI